jgi:hypothetical protein
MFRLRKYRARRAEIRKNRPDAAQVWHAIQEPEVCASLAIVLAFWIAATAITLLRDQIVRFLAGDRDTRLKYIPVCTSRPRAGHHAHRTAQHAASKRKWQENSVQVEFLSKYDLKK